MTEARASRTLRRLRRLAVVGALVGAVAAVRRVLLERDQRSFDDRYGPSADGSGPR